MTNAELVATYIKLLIFEYSDPNNQPNALATIQLLSSEAIANQIVGQVGAGFALSNIYGQTIAVGAQIDILAQFVGAQRNMPGFPFVVLPYFGFEDTRAPFDPTIGGFGDTTVGIPADFFEDTRTPSSNTTYIQSDAQLIELIQYLAIKENMYLSVENVDNLLFEFFGNLATVTETDTMVITYAISGSYTGLLYDIIKYFNAFPHPAGVRVLD
jgi:Protein of unknown function (DUF2612)